MNLYWLVSTLWKGELSGLEFQLCILAGALQEDRVSHVPELSWVPVIINMPAYLFKKKYGACGCDSVDCIQTTCRILAGKK